MGMTALTPAKRRWRRPKWSAGFGDMDIESAVGEAIIRCPELEAFLDINWVADRETAERVGWLLVKHPGITFRLGLRLLALASPDGYVMPPKEYQLCRDTEPTPEEMYRAPYLHPWSLVLFQSGSRPAEWQLSGGVYHPRRACTTQKFRLLYLHRDKKMAFTDGGWMKLGRRFAS